MDWFKVWSNLQYPLGIREFLFRLRFQLRMTTSSEKTSTIIYNQSSSHWTERVFHDLTPTSFGVVLYTGIIDIFRVRSISERVKQSWSLVSNHIGFLKIWFAWHLSELISWHCFFVFSRLTVMKWKLMKRGPDWQRKSMSMRGEMRQFSEFLVTTMLMVLISTTISRWLVFHFDFLCLIKKS